MKKDIVIFGAGHGGGMTSVFLRKFKYEGEILIIGEENQLPYQRPELSKDFLNGKISEKTLFIKKEEFYQKNKIEILLNCRVVSICKKKKEIVLENAEVIKYRILIIATGSSVKRLEIEQDNNIVRYLSNIQDSKVLKNKITSSNAIAIIGSGYIGLEVACAARHAGKKVTVIEIGERPMARTVSKKISHFFRDKHISKGVSFIFNTQLCAVNNKKENINLQLKDNKLIVADLVIAGIGISPNTNLASDSDIDCDYGIIVDENCMTSNKSIFAIGDCTKHPSKLYKKNLRLESVQNAVEQAKCVARYITGKPYPYNEVPWFWTNQYNLKLQIA